jgi:hypothetical protein
MSTTLTPPMILSYGEMGVGKTTDIVAAFPTACNVCRPGGLLPAATFLGLREGRIPPVRRNLVIDGKEQEWVGYAFQWHVRSLDDVITIVPSAAAMGFGAVTVDDVSLDAETTERDLDRQYGNQGGNVFRKFDGIRDRVVKIREACRYAGIPVAMSAHLRLPGPDSKGTFLKGGPKFPTRNLTESIPYEADVVLRMALASGGNWRSIYDRSDPDYAGKDRLSVTPLKAPGNLRAILVGAGYTLPRFPGLEWQDEAMVHVRDRMLKGDDREAVVRETFTTLKDQAPEHTAWAVRDGLALAEVQTFVNERYINDFFAAGAAKAGPVTLGGAV